MNWKGCVMSKKNPVDTICDVPLTKRPTWFDRLTPEQRKTVQEVAERVVSEELKKEPVARNLQTWLQNECSISVGITTLTTYLRLWEAYDNAK